MYNKKVSKPLNQMTNKKTCNCQNPPECPLDGNCCVKNIICKAEIESPKAFYVGMTARTVKERLIQHNTEKRRKCTILSDFMWTQKLTHTPEIKWSIVKKCKLRAIT